MTTRAATSNSAVNASSALSAPATTPVTPTRPQASGASSSVSAETSRDAVALNHMTTTVHRPTELLRTMLEERLRTHTNYLVQLTVCGAPHDSTGHDDDTVAALAAAARRGVANATHALRRMSQGTYGVCEACGKDIPLGRLRNLPHARFCVPCQRRAAQRWSAPLRTAHSRGTTGCKPAPIQARALSMNVPRLGTRRLKCASTRRSGVTPIAVSCDVNLLGAAAARSSGRARAEYHGAASTGAVGVWLVAGVLQHGEL